MKDFALNVFHTSLAFVIGGVAFQGIPVVEVCVISGFMAVAALFVFVRCSLVEQRYK